MHPADMIFYWAKANPERPAIIQPGMVVPYRSLAEAIASTCERIDELGLNDRDPVAVAIHHPVYQLVVCFALLRRGYACAPIGRSALPFLRSNGIDNLVHAAEGFVLSGGRNIRFDPSWLRRASGVATPRPSLASETPMIFFTSGTTGTPKMVVLPSGIFDERSNWLPIVGESSFERLLVVPGLNASFGFVRTAMIMFAGKTACFASDFEEQLRLINLFDIDLIVASPQQALGLVETIEKGTKYGFESLKEVRIAGGFCSRDLVARIKSCLRCTVTIKYGATEAGVIALADHDMIAQVPYAVGFPVPDVEVEIVGENDRPLPAGEEGIIRCRSVYFARAFAATNPDRAPNAKDVWWYPGDIGRLTEDGILCVMGRTDDVINSGGVKIAAGPLDEAIRQLPGVRDAGVCAVRGRSGVEEVWIGLVPEPGVDTAGLLNSIMQNKELRVVVGAIKIVENIPRNDLGKLQRNALKELLASMTS